MTCTCGLASEPRPSLSRRACVVALNDCVGADSTSLAESALTQLFHTVYYTRALGEGLGSKATCGPVDGSLCERMRS